LFGLGVEATDEAGRRGHFEEVELAELFAAAVACECLKI